MFTNVKVLVYKVRNAYHRTMADYYYGKVDEYGPENNEHWFKKISYHTNKRLDALNKLGMTTKWW